MFNQNFRRQRLATSVQAKRSTISALSIWSSSPSKYFNFHYLTSQLEVIIACASPCYKMSNCDWGDMEFERWSWGIKEIKMGKFALPSRCLLSVCQRSTKQNSTTLLQQIGLCRQGKPKPAVSLQTLRPLLGTIKFTFEFKQKFFFRTFCFKTMLYVMVHDNGKQMLIILYALVQIVGILS